MRLHGEPTCDVGGQRRALEPRAAALLALVAVDREVTRERAAALLWPESADPRSALRQQLARFRRLAGADLIDGTDRLRLAVGVATDLPDGGLAAADGSAAVAEPRGALLGDLRFPDQPAFDAWLMRQRSRSQSEESPTEVHAPADAPLPATLLRPPQMIGRAVELAALMQAWDAGQAVLLLGEAGLGKSRLLAEFAQSRRVLSAAARPGDAGVPYATLTRLLRLVAQRCTITLADHDRHELARLLPEMAPGADLPAEGHRLALQVAIVRALGGAHLSDDDATRVPLDGLIVDDLHFADDASIEMLQALVGALATTLRFAFAQRPGEGSAAAQALRDALEEGGLLTAQVMAPLSEAELGALVDSLHIDDLDAARLATALARHTGGNPLFALETLKQGMSSGALRAGELPQPASVGALIERRLQRLSAQGTALARVAVIAGPDFCPPLAEHALGVRAVALADAWDELQQAQVLRDSAFAHDLVADAVLRSVPASIAGHLHGEIARWLAQHDGEPARVARHWIQAGDDEEALPWLRAAGAQARRAGRMVEASGFLQQGADLCDRLGRADDAFDFLYDAASLASDSLGLDGITVMTEQLQQRARTDRQWAGALMMQAEVDYERGAPRAEVIVRGLACARASGERQTEGQLLFQEGKRLATTGDLHAARAAVTQSLDLMASLGCHDYVADKLSSLATLDSMLGDLKAADAAYERSRLLSIEHRVHEGQPMRLSSHALLKLELGDGNGARERLAQIEELEQAGLVTLGAASYRRAMLKGVLLTRLLLGEPAAAVRLYVDRIHGTADASDAGVAVLSAWLFDQLGRRDLMQQALQTARQAGPRNVSLALIRVLELRDDPAAAARFWAGDEPAAFGDLLTRCLTLGYLAQHAPPEKGVADLQAAIAQARAAGGTGYLGGLCAAVAELHARRGDDALADAAARESQAYLDGAGVFYRPWAWLRCATAYRVTGNEPQAQRCEAAGARLAQSMALTLPIEYQSAFRERNPVHRALLAPPARRA